MINWAELASRGNQDKLAADAARLLSDGVFKDKTKRMPADAVEGFALECAGYLNARHLLVSNVVLEPRQSETREAFKLLAGKFAALQAGLDEIDAMLGTRGGFFGLAERAKADPSLENVSYIGKQVASKRRTTPGLLEHGEVFADWLATHYERRDGRAGWTRPNDPETPNRNAVKEFSKAAMRHFGRPADAIVSHVAGLMLDFEISPEAVKKLRTDSGRKTPEII